MDLAGMERIS